VKLLKVERLDPLPNGLVGAQSTWEVTIEREGRIDRSAWQNRSADATPDVSDSSALSLDNEGREIAALVICPAKSWKNKQSRVTVTPLRQVNIVRLKEQCFCCVWFTRNVALRYSRAHDVLCNAISARRPFSLRWRGGQKQADIA
jgi:hypothetical protein